MSHLTQPMLRPISHWAEQSQRRACRNAMVASTSLNAGRRERDEVAHYVSTTLARRTRREASASFAPTIPPTIPPGVARLG